MRERDDDDQFQRGAFSPRDHSYGGVRCYVAYPLSTRHVEELMEERGVELDHATINRWVIKYSQQLAEAFHRCKRPVWVSWRMDEIYIKVKGHWYSLDRGVRNFQGRQPAAPCITSPYPG
jgi:putative transposase